MAMPPLPCTESYSAPRWLCGGGGFLHRGRIGEKRCVNVLEKFLLSFDDFLLRLLLRLLLQLFCLWYASNSLQVLLCFCERIVDAFDFLQPVFVLHEQSDASVACETLCSFEFVTVWLLDNIVND